MMPIINKKYFTVAAVISLHVVAPWLLQGCSDAEGDSDAGTGDGAGGGTGAWTTSTLESSGVTRTYQTYVPIAGGTNGVMLFIHGMGMTMGAMIYGYDVAAAADEKNFVAVVIQGSQDGGGGTYDWNYRDPNGVNEVNFIHAVMSAVTPANQPESWPQLVMGFSGGA